VNRRFFREFRPIGWKKGNPVLTFLAIGVIFRRGLLEEITFFVKED
jgi:hypothetical protein